MWEVKMKLVLKTKLGWAIFWGGGVGSVRIIINVFPNKFDLGNMVSNFGK